MELFKLYFTKYINKKNCSNVLVTVSIKFFTVVGKLKHLNKYNVSDGWNDC